MTQEWLNGTGSSADPSIFKGQILMSSTLLRDTRAIQEDGTTLFDYSTPTLTIGGTKDGLMRITRVAESYWHQVTNINASQMNMFPVSVLEGVSHYQFAGGAVPSFVASNDLRSDIADADARDLVGETMAKYIDQVLTGQVQAASTETAQYVAPFLEGMY